MANFNKLGPVWLTLREISRLPLEQRLDAFIDRLDILDENEKNKVSMNKNGDEYETTSNKVRLAISQVGKEWLADENAGAAKGSKFAALHRFNDAPRKAG